LDDGLLERVAGRAAVGIRSDLVGGMALVEKIQQAGRKVFEAFVAQRPDRRPFDLGRSVERGRRPRPLVRVGRRCLASLELRVAEQHDVVWKDGVARRKIREAPCHPDLVALIDPGIALDRLHQRAGFALLGGAALAVAAAAQARSERVDGLGARRKVVDGMKVGVQGQVDFDLFETRDHAGEGTHMLAEPRHRGRRRDGAVPPARHDQLAAGADLDRRRRTAGVVQTPHGRRPGHCGRAAT
jgi:hypothetical protein